MGMYDQIKHEIKCPVCTTPVTNFQSKDMGDDCYLNNLEYYEVDYFYATCPGCGTQFEYEYKYKEDRTKRKLDDYELTVSNAPENYGERALTIKE